MLEEGCVPVTLITSPPEFARLVAKEWEESNPTSSFSVLETIDGANIGNEPVETLEQHWFDDDDITWYLKRKGLKVTQSFIELIDGNASLCREAGVSVSHMSYFLKTLQTGERMRADTYQVQSCIKTIVANSGVELPVELVEYVLEGTPQYGPWTPQHIDMFYDILRRS